MGRGTVETPDREIPFWEQVLQASKNRQVSQELKVRRENVPSYCKVSIKRVIVRFRSLSDRRISSILLIECSTVV
jgi:hypothetical protein